MIRIVHLEFQSSKYELIPIPHSTTEEQSKKERNKAGIPYHWPNSRVTRLRQGTKLEAAHSYHLASGPSQATLRSYSIWRIERGLQPPLERSSVLLESPNSHASSLPELLEYLRYFQHAKQRRKVHHWVLQLILFYIHSQEEMNRFLGADFPITAPFGWLWSITALWQKPRNLLKEASLQFQPSRMSYYLQFNHGSNFFWGS